MAGKRRVRRVQIGPEVMRLTAQGYSINDLCKKFGVSRPTISRIRREHTLHGGADLFFSVPQPKTRDQLSAEITECLQDSVEAFSLFYSRYAGEYPNMPPHALEFVKAAHGEDQCVINVPPGHMKLCADDTPVLTTEGWATHGELAVGDQVFAPSGQSVEVTHVHPKSYASARVRFSDGAYVETSWEHEWVVRDRGQFRGHTGKRRGVVRDRVRKVETRGMLEAGLTVEGGRRSRFFVERTNALQFPKAQLPLDPYFLGVWLGDGKSEGASICGTEEDLGHILFELAARGFDPSWETVHKDTGVVYKGFRGVQPVLRTIGVFGNKHIPEMYLLASEEQRRDLLRGLVDTDGSLDARGRVRFVNVNARLVRDVEELVRSLGYRPSTTTAQPVGIGKQVSYTVQWTPHDGERTGYLPRKDVRRVKVRRERAVAAIEAITPKPGNCITVEGGVYLVGRELVPTHNSTTFSIWLPIWEVAKNRDIQILLLSKAHDLSIEFCRAIAYELENNERLVSELGRFKPEAEGGSWAPGVGKLSVEGRNRSKSHGGTLLARGAGQQVYGFRADLIIADDLVDTDTVRTPELREKTSEWYHVILHSRRRVEGKTWVIGTRFHPEDIYGELVAQTVTGEVDAKALYKHINFPALRDPDTGAPTSDFDSGVALWPEEWPADKLRTKVYEHVGATIWQQTYQQVALDDNDVLARPEWIFGKDEDATEERRGCLDLTRVIGSGATGNPERVRVISVDPSPTKFAGIVVADVVPLPNGDREIVILEIVRDKLLQRPLMQTIERMVTEHSKVHYLIFEVNSFARWFTQDIDFHDWSKQNSIRVLSHTTHRNKTDSERGLESLSREFEFGRIRLPYADPFAKNMSLLLIKEATQYTPAYKGTTDVLMATWFIHFNRNKLRPPNRFSQQVKGWVAPARLKSGFRGRAVA